MILIQVAANQKGIHLVTELIDAYGLDVVQAYMGFIQVDDFFLDYFDACCLSCSSPSLVYTSGQSIL